MTIYGSLTNFLTVKNPKVNLLVFPKILKPNNSQHGWFSAIVLIIITKNHNGD